MQGMEATRDVGALIRDEIAHSGPITFARFMELALYHPTLGYYAGGGVGREPLGWTGDYFTSSDVSPLWGWALARQLREMWELLGRPPHFDVIEAGAGRGLLAREVWRFARISAPEWGEALHYTLVDGAAMEATPRDVGELADDSNLPVDAGETSLAPTPIDGTSAARAGGLCGRRPPGAVSTASTSASETSLAPTPSPGGPLFELRRAKLAGDLARLSVPEDRVRWVGSLAEVATVRSGRELADASGAITGVILSNELIDALPVHIVQATDDTTPRLAEVYVDVDTRGRLIERLGAPSSPQVADSLDRFGIPWRTYGAGWRAEVNLAAEHWMREAANELHRGFLLTIDYGASARRLYTRDRRHGTLAVYARHQFGDKPLASPGQQDITAHVNFSALARTGCAQGLAVAGYTTQGAFLRRLGVMQAARMLGQRLYPEADSERQSDRGQTAVLRRKMLESAAATLLDPHGLGGFRVLVQQRGVPNAGHELTGTRRGLRH